MRVRLDLRYDGTGFHGWAAQPGLRTVEGELTGGLNTVLRREVRLTVAGRTDTGVHARGQVAHVDIDDEAWVALPGRGAHTPAAALVSRLAGVLPRDVVVTRAAVVTPEFDARFGALWRRYCYRVADEPALRDPLRRNEVLWTRRQLDLDAVNEALAPLLGEQDFLPFCRPREGASTVRTLLDLRWERGEGGLALAHVRADAFCHHMVRALVGVSLAVGEGRRPLDWPARLLAAGARDSSVPVVDPHGLTLEEVGYPEDRLLAEQASAARVVRGALHGRSTLG